MSNEPSNKSSNGSQDSEFSGLTFKKTSFLYKMNTKIGDTSLGVNAINAKTLCAYFWASLWNLVIAFFYILCGWTIFTILGVSINDSFPMSLETFFNLPEYYWAWFVGLMTLVITICTAIILLVSGWWLFDKFVEVCQIKKSDSNDLNKNENKNKKKKSEPSVILEWFKAKKKKYCPMIKFED